MELKLSTKVRKIEAARRQLKTAIEFWFAEGDEISIHTLASASHQIIHDLNHNQKNEPLILDRPEFTKDQRKLFAKVVKVPANFFKHADRGDSAEATSVDFDPLVNDMFISISTQGLKQLGYVLNGHEIAFCIWEAIHHPQVLNDEAIELLNEKISTEGIDSMKKIPRKEFLQRVLQLLNQQRA